MSKSIYDKILQFFKNRCENNLKKERKEAIFVKSGNDISKIFNIITDITIKVKELGDNLHPEVRKVIADKIKDYYLNSDLDPKSNLISYKLFMGIAGMLISKNNITIEELDRLTVTTKRYFVENKTNIKMIKKSLHLYENLKQDLSKS